MITGYAIIQLPEYTLALYGFIKRRAFYKSSSTSSREISDVNFVQQNERVKNDRDQSVSDGNVAFATRTKSDIFVLNAEQYRIIQERLDKLESK